MTEETDGTRERSPGAAQEPRCATEHPALDLEGVRRMAREGLPVLPETVLALVERVEALERVLTRYTNGDACEYGDGPPCPGDGAVAECRYCQAVGTTEQRLLAAIE